MDDTGSEDPSAPVTRPVAVLAFVNALSFATGALLHAGVQIGAMEEPIVRPAMVLQVVAAILLMLVTMGAFTDAPWARRLGRFANTFALVTVAAVAMLIGLDGARNSAGLKAMQVIRVILAAASLLTLYHSGQRARIR
jgi:hypothetical protein